MPNGAPTTISPHLSKSPVSAVLARSFVLLVVVCALLVGCTRKPASIAVEAVVEHSSQPSEASVVAVVDTSTITLGHLQQHLPAQKPGSKSTDPQVLAQAMVAAIVDALLLRELAVLDIRPRANERQSDAARRLSAEVFSPQRHCGGVSGADLRLAYMSELSRFKHPASWTVWSAIAATRADGDRLAKALRDALPSPPDLPADATCTGPTSPVFESHAQAFERVVGSLPLAATQAVLRRYTFYDQDDPKIPRGHFRGTVWPVAEAVRAMKIGGLAGPVKAHDGHHVVLLVCRDRRRFDGPEAPNVQIDLRNRVCKGAAEQARQDHVERLIKGATVTYRRQTLTAAFGADALEKLPPDSTARRRPTLPSERR